MSYSVALQLAGKRTVKKYVVFDSTYQRNVGTRYKKREDAERIARIRNKNLRMEIKNQLLTP